MSFVVYVDMVGDLFHAGHVRFLQHARALAEERADGRDVKLVAGLMGDEAAGSYKRRPVQPLVERMIVVGACRYVDEVVGDAPMPVDDPFLDAHAIDLVVHGDDMAEDRLAYWYAAPLARGIFAVVPYTREIDGAAVSTSELIRRVGESAEFQ
ncbi:MAG TPA: adenylyltransferase/cytidyltransferase family protein [Gaiellaceae bacterium]|nr:adenylyltransferase/cytidyltransferase family protein [Gaiellaceae bacterium]